MSISREEQFAALQEAQSILQLEKKWHRLVPDERKPNFKRAARVILERALGHTAVGKEPALRVHSGLMHEHDEREARLIERTLRNGTVAGGTQVLSSFRDGARARPTKRYIQAIVGSRTPVPAGEPFIDTTLLNFDVSDLGQHTRDALPERGARVPDAHEHAHRRVFGQARGPPPVHHARPARTAARGPHAGPCGGAGIVKNLLFFLVKTQHDASKRSTKHLRLDHGGQEAA